VISNTADVMCTDTYCFVELMVDTYGGSTQVELEGTIHGKREITVFTEGGDQIDRTMLEDIPFDVTKDVSYGEDIGNGFWIVSFSVDVPYSGAKSLGRELGRHSSMGDGGSSHGGYLDFDSMDVSCTVSD